MYALHGPSIVQTVTKMHTSVRGRATLEARYSLQRGKTLGR